ncbi:hypothetical protein [Vibrio algicola]|uniref:hypothetical protein n=1 Tax=Vibrio algicola TaxID=2662262 RepID=UPI0015B55180|nr:hypothetical protein [Vibrio algicola]
MTDKTKKITLTKKHKILLVVSAVLIVSAGYSLMPTSHHVTHNRVPVNNELSQLNIAPPSKRVPGITKSKKKEVTKKSTITLDPDAIELVRYANQLRIQTIRKMAIDAQIAADSSADKKADSLKYHSSPLKSKYVLPPIPGENSVNLNDDIQPSFIEDMRVASLISVNGNIEAVISFQNQYIPIRVGSKIGSVTITKITKNAVTFRDHGKSKTKWVASAPLTKVVKGA